MKINIDNTINLIYSAISRVALVIRYLNAGIENG
jgi:hypothetical protein